MTSENGVDAVHLLEKASGAQVKFVHVVRNPFDNIATMTLQHRQVKGRDGTHETKVSYSDVYITYRLKFESVQQNRKRK